MIKTKQETTTLETFLRELKLVSEYFQWANRCEKLRAFSIKEPQIYCPLTAVSFALYGKEYPPSCWLMAARAMGMDETLAALIAKASDNEIEGDEYLENIREDIFNVVGL